MTSAPQTFDRWTLPAASRPAEVEQARRERWVDSGYFKADAGGDKPPFTRHGMVRDRYGKKMSKSFGTVVDPLDWIERYGGIAAALSALPE